MTSYSKIADFNYHYNKMQKSFINPMNPMNPTNPDPFEKLKQRWQKTKEQNALRANEIKTLLTNDCITVYQSFGIEKVILFGSLINSKFNEQSDVCLYVQPIENKNYWNFQHSLENILNLDIDLHTNTDEPSFIKKILDRGEIIYEA